MLDETNKALSLLKEKNKIEQIKKAKRRYLIAKYRKILKYTVLGISFLCVLIFPVETGTLIGQWISNFFVTIYNIVSQSVR